MKRYLSEKIKSKKGSIMLESMILLAVGLLVLMGFMAFLDSGALFAENSINQIGMMSRPQDNGANLGVFRRIP